MKKSKPGKFTTGFFILLTSKVFRIPEDFIGFTNEIKVLKFYVCSIYLFKDILR